MTFAAGRRKGPMRRSTITASRNHHQRALEQAGLGRTCPATFAGAIGNPAGRTQPREDQNGRHVEGRSLRVLGFDLRRVHKRKKDGYTIQMTPKKKARKVVKAKIRDIIRSGGATPVAVIVARRKLLVVNPNFSDGL
jgi:hypothetical protein